MKLGVFGGSFDPVHLGHKNLVVECKKRLNLDKVLVIPAACSPFKEDRPPIASPEQRLEMLKMTFEDLEGVEVSDIEIKRGGLSFTVDTIRDLANQYSNDQLFLLMADSTYERFQEWKSSEEIQTLSHLVFVSSKKEENQMDKNVTSIEIPWIQISSTIIRRKLKRGDTCKKYLSSKVLDFISTNGLYS